MIYHENIKKEIILEEIEKFRDKRISEVYNNPENEGYNVIFHAIPLESFTGKIFNIKDVEKELQTLDGIKGDYLPSFEGKYYKYDIVTCQIYRNGILEKIIDGKEFKGNVCLIEFERKYYEFIESIFKLYEKLGVSLPIFFFITYTNIKGCFQPDSLGMNRHDIFEKDRDVLPSKGIMFEEYNKELIEENVAMEFTPFYNHFGYNHS